MANANDAEDNPTANASAKQADSVNDGEKELKAKIAFLKRQKAALKEQLAFQRQGWLKRYKQRLMIPESAFLKDPHLCGVLWQQLCNECRPSRVGRVFLPFVPWMVQLL